MVYLSSSAMKRAREGEHDNITTMANCLMLLSHGADFNINSRVNDNNLLPSRVFECKTCNRQFPSFQALGGHRASHKKPKLMAELSLQSHFQAPPAKPKTHECSICGLEFPIGQALGGHMRRHRAVANDQIHHEPPLSLSPPPHVPVVKKSNSRRVLCLDLNLTPLENDLEFVFGKVAPPPLDSSGESKLMVQL